MKFSLQNNASDYLIDYLFQLGIQRIYGISGGANLSFCDAIAKFQKIQFVPCHHEQHAGFAAFGESKATGKLSVVTCVTGCGGTNCITPLLAAWQDSVPVLFISGNVNYQHTTHYLKKHKSLNLRKFGIQENNIIENVKNICKYAVCIEKIEDFTFEVEKAIYLSIHGRPGPVWLDIPSNIQSTVLDDKNVYHFVGNFFSKYVYDWDDSVGIKELKEDLQKTHRPLVIAGNGIEISESQELFRQFIEKYNLPFVTSYLGINLIDTEHLNNIGRIGIKGNRAANFAIQNADLLLVLGCSLGNSHVGYSPNLFSPKSKKIIVDIDIDEHQKELVKVDYFIRCDLKKFFEYTL